MRSVTDPHHAAVVVALQVSPMNAPALRDITTILRLRAMIVATTNREHRIVKIYLAQRRWQAVFSMLAIAQESSVSSVKQTIVSKMVTPASASKENTSQQSQAVVDGTETTLALSVAWV